MNQADQHDAYASEYDRQVQAMDCHIADILFGMCYEFLHPGQVLLDAGIGSGLSTAPFSSAGLEAHGMDFSFNMLRLCAGKKLARSLCLHDIQATPWPYPKSAFHLVICCGVFHFIAEIESLFAETARILKPGALFAFTSKFSLQAGMNPERWHKTTSGEFEIYAHNMSWIEKQLAVNQFGRLKSQKCFIGEDIFIVWVSRKI